MTLEQMRLRFRDQYLRTRSIQRVIESEEFKIIFPKLKVEEKHELENSLLKLDKKSIENLISRKLDEIECLGALSVVMLREKANRLGIKNYQYMNKSSLLSEIENVRQNRNNVS